MAARLQAGDALILVDVQLDFLPGGSLAVSHGDEVVPALNRYIAVFRRLTLPVVATRDWHPPAKGSTDGPTGTRFWRA